MHYFFMRKVCKTYLNNIKPYDPKVLVVIAVIFMGIGFLYIPLYSNMVARYGFTAILLLILYINRKKLVSAISEKLGKK